MFIGRDYELQQLRKQLTDRSRAQLLVLYGRRRVGKSRLIQEAIRGERRVLLFEGIQGQTAPVQIARFLDDLAAQTGNVRLAAADWAQALRGLGEVIRRGRWVVVLDELPWLAAGRTRFIAELKRAWDSWTNPELAMFLCGSVASFMSKHVVHSKALHNRKTLEICLNPLPPHEAARFIAKRGEREKAQLYMCLGGVPKYLEQIDPRRSLEKNLNRLCFMADGFFVNEFETLFKEQFKSLKVYTAIVAALAAAPANLTELAKKVGAAKGGGFGAQLQNLINAQVIRAYRPLLLPRGAAALANIPCRRRTRTLQYKLVDPFLIFYFRYIHQNRHLIARNKKENLYRAIVGPTADQYFDYAFERLGEDGFARIRERLGIALADVVDMGPHFRRHSLRGGGLQIDWLILRRDHVWSLIEYKYSRHRIGKSVIDEVNKKVSRLAVPNRVTVEKVLVTAAGVTKDVARTGYFDEVVTLGDLVG